VRTCWRIGGVVEGVGLMKGTGAVRGRARGFVEVLATNLYCQQERA
jgi:hypothetical protein